jgi:hypothetical protein
MSAARDRPRKEEKAPTTGPLFQKQHTQPLWAERDRLTSSLAGALQG